MTFSDFKVKLSHTEMCKIVENGQKLHVHGSSFTKKNTIFDELMRETFDIVVSLPKKCERASPLVSRD